MQSSTQEQKVPKPLHSLVELERVFKEHHGLVFQAAYRVTGSTDDAEDVLQTVFLRLLKHEGPWSEIDGARPGAGLGGYLRRAAVNASIDVVRARKRRGAVPLGEVERDLEDGGERAPEAVCHQQELAHRLRQLLATLHPRTAEIFILRYVEGYDNTEIAQLLGSSRASIAVTLHRARRRLEKQLRSLLGGVS